MEKNKSFLSMWLILNISLLILTSVTSAQLQIGSISEVSTLKSEGRVEPAGESKTALAHAVYEVGSGKYQFRSKIK